MRRDALEWFMVLEGKLQLIINGVEMIIQNNGAVRFLADVPHEYNNPSSDCCAAFNVIFYPNR